MQTDIFDFVSTKCNTKRFAYEERFTEERKSVHMRQFAGVSKFAYMQMNTRMGTPAHVYRAYSLYYVLVMQSSKGCSSWGRLFPNFSDFRLVGGVGLNSSLRSISVLSNHLAEGVVGWCEGAG